MGCEIEHKFLLKSAAWRPLVERSVAMAQGYFEGSPDSPTVRVRIAGETAFLTVKGRPGAGRLGRSEFEYAIPTDDAYAMLKEFCGSRLVSKTRHYVHFEGKCWEIDEYDAPFDGLFTAEIELTSETEEFAVPDWVGEDVSGNPAYTNGALARSQKRP